MHVLSLDLGAPPVLDPKFGLLEWDVKVQIALSRFLREVIRSGDMGDIFDKEVVPGLNRVPEGAGEEIWKDWIGEQSTFVLFVDTPNYHAVGSTLMLPAEMGGVVNDRFTV
ncbi:hypothetical protein BJX64DRAFT_285901 [Aspergillus heterothallicus]